MGGNLVHKHKTKKEWTWWENEPLQSKSKSAEQTKKDRNFSLPPITAHIFWSFPNGFRGANHLFSNWNFRFSHVNGLVLLAYYFAEMVTLGATFIGSLTIYDDNNKENVQKDKLIFSLLPDNDVKRPNMTFYGGREHTSTRNRCFFFFTQSLDAVPKEINAMKKILPHLTNWARLNKHYMVCKKATALNIPWVFTDFVVSRGC